MCWQWTERSEAGSGPMGAQGCKGWKHRRTSWARETKLKTSQCGPGCSCCYEIAESRGPQWHEMGEAREGSWIRGEFIVGNVYPIEMLLAPLLPFAAGAIRAGKGDMTKTPCRQ